MIHLFYLGEERLKDITCQRSAAQELLRSALLDEYGKRLEDLRMVRNAWGKPMVYGDDTIQFSISHCRDGAAVSLSRTRTGIDMERIRPFSMRTAEKVLTPDEFRFVTSSAQGELDFFRLWTLKESYVKALGTGASYPFRKMEFRVDEQGSDIRFSRSRAVFQLHEEMPGFIVAVCHLRDPGDGDIEDGRVRRHDLSKRFV
ncbi:MAG TPA: 4'-phosphopantetheinyl transferase superfamily protein [Clostridiaceae bacterium]|nr:4'-phosphopantetheinyl transferase superfamily protein [Clostridiaceae bacterium]